MWQPVIVYQTKEKGEALRMQDQYDDDQTGDLIIKISPGLHKRIKIAATQSGLSVKEYVERILEQTVPHETSPVEKRNRGLNPAAVDKLLQTREAIIRAHPGQVFEDSVELIRQAREERTRELEQR